MNLAKEKRSWDPTKTFCPPETVTKSLKIKKNLKYTATKNSKTQLRYKITSKIEINNLTNKTLTSRGTRENKWDCQSSTYDFGSRNKIKER